MNKTEIRIGNIIKSNSITIDIDNKSFTVTGITEGSVWGKYKYLNMHDQEDVNEVPVYYKHLSGMPLTEEWLIKFGFEKIKERDGSYYNHSIDYHYNNGALSVGCDNENGYEIPIKIEYVHQLQNLFFALTGKELSIINP